MDVNVRLAHVGISVSDLDKAVAFFRDICGFTVGRRYHASTSGAEKATGVAGARLEVAFIDAGGQGIELLAYDKPDDRSISTLRPCDSGHLHLALEVSDIDEMLARMKQADFLPVGPVYDTPAISMGPNQKASGKMRVIYTTGMDNLTIELIQKDK